jgi:hypothetical protein
MSEDETDWQRLAVDMGEEEFGGLGEICQVWVAREQIYRLEMEKVKKLIICFAYDPPIIIL